MNAYRESMLVIEAPATLIRSVMLCNIFDCTGITSTLMNSQVLNFTSHHFDKLNCTVPACSRPHYRLLQSYCYMSGCEYKSEIFQS